MVVGCWGGVCVRLHTAFLKFRYLRSGNGGPAGIRTLGRPVKSRTLYLAELQAPNRHDVHYPAVRCPESRLHRGRYIMTSLEATHHNITNSG